MNRRRKLAVIFVALPAALAMGGLLFLRFGLRGDVTGTQARALVAAGARLVDVRSPQEFADGHLAGATNIPVGDLADRVGDLGPPDQALVLYCRSGMRSGRAATALRERGFSRVHNLGPMSAW